MFEELKPKGDEAWLELRRKVITATESSVLLGLNPWKSAKEIVESKKKIEPFENAYTIIGQELEPVVVSLVNRALHKNFKLFENGSRSFFADFDLGLGATPDAGDEVMLLECKTTKPGNWLKWQYWPPQYYLCQLYTQMYCTNRQYGLLGILSTDLTQTSEILKLPLIIFKLERFEEMDYTLEEEVKRFWETTGQGKAFRINRKQGLKLEWLLRNNLKRIY